MARRLTMRPTLRVVSRASPQGFARPRKCRFRKSAESKLRLVGLRARRGKPRGAFRQDTRGGPLRRLAQRDVALLLALSADQNRFVGPVDVFEVEAGEFGVADAAAIEQLKDGAVAGGPTGGLFVDRYPPTRFICSMEGTRGRCLGSLGVGRAQRRSVPRGPCGQAI